MKLVEKFIRGKRSNPELCEDGVFFNTSFAAVIDGCSSSKPPLEGLNSSGVIAKNLVLSVLETLPKESTMHEAFTQFNSAIRQWYQEHNLLETMKQDASLRCSAYIAMISKARREVWILGDCQALIQRQLYTCKKPIDDLMENLRAMYIEVELQKGAHEAEVAAKMHAIQERLAQQMAYQSIFQNSAVQTSFSYSVLDGFFTSLASVLVIKLEEATQEVALGSDGYPLLLSTLEETEKHLASLLSDDPLCYTKNRATKGVEQGNVSFDDRSYLRVIV